ncbi:Holliday junction resolvase [Candidatus Woesearchaeota archaeon]|nr:Holliday junction resolvase [Candidatus Woesearchaeota archaeon]
MHCSNTLKRYLNIDLLTYHMSNKKKGCNAERELIHLFWNNDWSAIRIAGSGSSHYPSADILASNIKKLISIEVKITKKKNKYFTQKEIDDFRQFSSRFGALPYIAIRFPRTKWYFLKLDQIPKKTQNYAISENLAKKKGIGFDELIKGI